MLIAILQGNWHKAKRARQAPAFVPIAIAMLITVFSGSTTAEIYKWTDANGNVHFGDKPIDAGVAAKAKAVELTPGYEPVQRTREEQAVFSTQQNSLRQASDARRGADQKKQDEMAGQRREEKVERCARWKEKAAQLSQLEVGENGGRALYYLTNEAGKSMTVSEQEKVIAELREKISRERC